MRRNRNIPTATRDSRRAERDAAAYSVGNLAKPGSGVLATIVSQDPVYVSSRQLLEVQEQAARQRYDPSRAADKVRAAAE